MNEFDNQVGRPPANLDECFTKIKVYLELGYSFHKSCQLAEIPYSTFKPYFDKNESFRNKISREQSQVNLIARRNIVNKIKAGDLKLSQKWIELFDIEDFSNENKKNKDIPSNFVYIPPSWFKPSIDSVNNRVQEKHE